MASSPADEHCYILNSFEEFEALARRALHEDMHVGPHQNLNSSECNGLCERGSQCCHAGAQCTCGIYSGQYSCLCPKGHYGSGMRGECQPCPQGTYQPSVASGDKGICLPCPHAHQNSPPGSTSVMQCHCRRGYSAEGHSCRVVHCQMLRPPANGYLVNSDCGVVFNAACGFRCNPGYRLIGNSIRVCQQSGTWSGSDPVCEKKKCRPLEAPFLGSINCSTGAFDFETVCEFECQRGYVLIGSRKRSCLSIALWDGLPTLCRRDCPPLPAPANGIFSPTHCSDTKSSFGEICHLQCNEGFAPPDQASRECMHPGMWSGNDTAMICVGENCPENMEFESEPGYAEALVDWEPLEASDNSGESLMLNVVPAIMPPQLFSLGTSDVSYWAQDAVGNKAFCNFSVVVKDTEPPTVDSCVSPPDVFSDGNPSAVVTWDEPVFSDNSGTDPVVWQSHAQGAHFPVGETLVTYVASDISGNDASCILRVVVRGEALCVIPPAPANGNVDCRKTASGIGCRISCLQGYNLQPGVPSEFSCTFHGIWSPYDIHSFPDCSGELAATRGVAKCPDGLDCSFNNVHIECPTAEAGLNDLGDFVHRREKRSKQAEDIEVSFDVTGVCLRTSESHQSVLIAEGCDFPVRFQDGGVDFGSAPVQLKIMVWFRFSIFTAPVKCRCNCITSSPVVRGRLGSTSTTPPQGTDLLFSMKNFFAKLRDAIVNKEFDLMVQQENIAAKSLEVSEEVPKFSCNVGSIPSGTECVKCPRGTFYNVSETSGKNEPRCLPCPKGTYQSEEGREICVACPDLKSTLTVQSKNVTECRALCLPGSHSATGMVPCETCRKAFFQPGYGMTSCVACPNDTRARRRGSVHESDCKAKHSSCPPSLIHLSHSTMPCFSLPLHFYCPCQLYLYLSTLPTLHSCILRTSPSSSLNIIIADLSLLNSNANSFPSAPQILISFCKYILLSAISTMSSAYINPGIDCSIFSPCLNGDKGHPCLRPRCISTGAVTLPSHVIKTFSSFSVYLCSLNFSAIIAPTCFAASSPCSCSPWDVVMQCCSNLVLRLKEFRCFQNFLAAFLSFLFTLDNHCAPLLLIFSLIKQDASFLHVINVSHFLFTSLSGSPLLLAYLCSLDASWRFSTASFTSPSHQLLGLEQPTLCSFGGKLTKCEFGTDFIYTSQGRDNVLMRKLNHSRDKYSFLNFIRLAACEFSRNVNTWVLIINSVFIL
ncbi:unnamed protein product [Ixodes hexagonus]